MRYSAGGKASDTSAKSSQFAEGWPAEAARATTLKLSAIRASLAPQEEGATP